MWYKVLTRKYGKEESSW